MVQIFRNSFAQWLSTNLNFELKLKEIDIILGIPQVTDIVSHLHLQTKYFIFKTKFNCKNLVIINLIRELQTNYKIEKYNAMINSIYEEFEKIWRTTDYFLEN